MAKRKTNLTPTPLMALSMMAIFIMMPVIFGLANSKTTSNKSYAKDNPTPTPKTELKINTDNEEPMKLRITQ